MSPSPIDPRLPIDPPIDLRAHPRPIGLVGKAMFHRRCPAVFAPLTDDFVRARAKRRANPPATGKVCPTCETWKPWDQYYPDSLQSNGHRTYCKACCSDRASATYHGQRVPTVRQRLAARRAAERERERA